MGINSEQQLSTKLPKKYQLATKANQKCSNCGFYEPAGYCTLWKAHVQSFAWCAKWKGVVNGS